MAEKRSRTEELLEALMLRMDTMDQAIASLKVQTSSSGVVASSNEDVPWWVGMPSSEAIPPAPKRVRGRVRGPTANFVPHVPARAVPHRGAGAAIRTNRRSRWDSAATPARAVGCVRPPGTGGDLRPCLLIEAAAPSEDAGRARDRVGGPHAAAAVPGSCSHSEVPGEPDKRAGPGRIPILIRIPCLSGPVEWAWPRSLWTRPGHMEWGPGSKRKTEGDDMEPPKELLRGVLTPGSPPRGQRA
ncbi:hypothetical protein NDU88_009908 [Pleurodeles waltl]|uniref:Uncharacterized protein n=1 Tax=Pleurodeles waltl TaxID=8319 RepID=A0AAV7PTM7_PLEWA|nr:hypothetical protein NDU88_009908 [Pleurodeles waltl]